jgi:hypothetical protein
MLLAFFTKQPGLIRSSIVLSLPYQLEFLDRDQTPIISMPVSTVSPNVDQESHPVILHMSITDLSKLVIPIK